MTHLETMYVIPTNIESTADVIVVKSDLTIGTFSVIGLNRNFAHLKRILNAANSIRILELNVDYLSKENLSELGGSLGRVEALEVRHDIGDLEMLGDIIYNTPTLTSLKFVHIDFSTSDLRILAQILRRDTKLKDISLTYDKLNNESIKIIADAFDSSMVTTLDISANKISDVGLEYLMEKLKKSHVTDLSIISNKITDGGLEIVSRAIDDGMRLEKLSIGGDESMIISDSGVSYLVKMITGSSLKSFRLIGAKLTHSGFSYFVEALGQNSSLEHLTLGASNLSSMDLDKFLTVLEKGGGSSLTEITLLVRSNDLSLWDRINKILERNKHNVRTKETSFFFGLLKSLKDDL